MAGAPQAVVTWKATEKIAARDARKETRRAVIMIGPSVIGRRVELC
jgi:hypothetical protein